MTIRTQLAPSEKPTSKVPEFGPWPHFSQDEIEAVERVLRSGKVNYWTGEEGRLFEKEFAQTAGCQYAVAVANGTNALELALKAAGVGSGDEVITTSRTFIASASSAVTLGATPVIVDVDRDSQNLTAETILPAITSKTKAIIAVHLAGWACDMDPINELARSRGIVVIEDCAQAQGAKYKGRPVGSLGDMAAFSFCQDKIMTTLGEGGMFTTNSEAYWRAAWEYKDHGKSYDAVYNREHPFGFRWLHESFGTNWRMTEVQSAAGRVMLKKIPDWVEKRRENASLLLSQLHQCPLARVPEPPSEVYHSFYKFYLFIRDERLATGWTRDRIVQEITSRGVPCFVGSCSEIYLEKAFDGIRPPARLEVARQLGDASVMLLVHPTLSSTAVQYTGEIAGEILTKALR